MSWMQILKFKPWTVQLPSSKEPNHFEIFNLLDSSFENRKWTKGKNEFIKDLKSGNYGKGIQDARNFFNSIKEDEYFELGEYVLDDDIPEGDMINAVDEVVTEAKKYLNEKLGETRRTAGKKGKQYKPKPQNYKDYFERDGEFIFDDANNKGEILREVAESLPKRVENKYTKYKIEMKPYLDEYPTKSNPYSNQFISIVYNYDGDELKGYEKAFSKAGKVQWVRNFTKGEMQEIKSLKRELGLTEITYPHPLIQLFDLSNIKERDQTQSELLEDYKDISIGTWNEKKTKQFLIGFGGKKKKINFSKQMKEMKRVGLIQQKKLNIYLKELLEDDLTEIKDSLFYGMSINLEVKLDITNENVRNYLRNRQEDFSDEAVENYTRKLNALRNSLKYSLSTGELDYIDFLKKEESALERSINSEEEVSKFKKLVNDLRNVQIKPKTETIDKKEINFKYMLNPKVYNSFRNFYDKKVNDDTLYGNAFRRQKKRMASKAKDAVTELLAEIKSAKDVDLNQFSKEEIPFAKIVYSGLKGEETLEDLLGKTAVGSEGVSLGSMNSWSVNNFLNFLQFVGELYDRSNYNQLKQLSRIITLNNKELDKKIKEYYSLLDTHIKEIRNAIVTDAETKATEVAENPTKYLERRQAIKFKNLMGGN
tara:strand:+ start:4088 stop:6040 length:1953 start_codon:yes stop_codon:yes gene_type:complete